MRSNPFVGDYDALREVLALPILACPPPGAVFAALVAWVFGVKGTIVGVATVELALFRGRSVGQATRSTQEEMLRKRIEFYVIDGYKVAREAGMGSRINTIMQTCFFAISGVLPRDEAIKQIKKSIQKTYGKRGDAVVQKNFAAVDHALAHLEKVELPAAASSSFDVAGAISDKAPNFVHDVLGQIAAARAT